MAGLRNIAHGCNSVMATRTALKLADYVVTEAGFGADLGAEKFIDIKCRKSGLRPAAAVIVATMRAIKYHGGVDVPNLGRENLAALQKGIANLDRHVDNVRDVFGLPCLVAINHRAEDTDAKLNWIVDRASHHGIKVIVSRHYAEGEPRRGERREGGRRALRASELLQVRIRRKGDALGQDEDHRDARVRRLGDHRRREDPRPDQGAARIGLRALSGLHGEDAVFVLDRSALRGAPHGHVVNIREVRLSAGAEFVVMSAATS